MTDVAHWNECLSVCEQAARAGGAVLLDWMGRFSVREKGPADLVTEADEASQKTIQGIVLGAFPDHAFLAEEGKRTETASESGYRWIVDPLDGTTNYVHGLPHFAVSIGLEYRGELVVGVVFDPLANDCFSAAKGQGAFLNGQCLQVSAATQASEALVAVGLPTQVRGDSREIATMVALMTRSRAIRRMGSTALNLSYVAAGRLDGCWCTGAKSWDVAAGVLLVREAGGQVTAADGNTLDIDRPNFLAAATPGLHAELLLVLRNA